MLFNRWKLGRFRYTNSVRPYESTNSTRGYRGWVLIRLLLCRNYSCRCAMFIMCKYALFFANFHPCSRKSSVGLGILPWSSEISHIVSCVQSRIDMISFVHTNKVDLCPRFPTLSLVLNLGLTLKIVYMCARFAPVVWSLGLTSEISLNDLRHVLENR